MKEKIDAYILERIEKMNELLSKDQEAIGRFLFLATDSQPSMLLATYYKKFSQIFNHAKIPQIFSGKSAIKKEIETILEDFIILINGPDQKIFRDHNEIFQRCILSISLLQEERKYAREKINTVKDTFVKPVSWVERLQQTESTSGHIELTPEQETVLSSIKRELKANFDAAAIQELLQVLAKEHFIFRNNVLVQKESTLFKIY